MPSRRPAPLSEETLLRPAAPVLLGSKGPLGGGTLGALCAKRLSVKNTFLDGPSPRLCPGPVAPASAPADTGREGGFVQFALESAAASAAANEALGGWRAPYGTPLATPTPSGVSSFAPWARAPYGTPLATPTPSGVSSFAPWARILADGHSCATGGELNAGVWNVAPLGVPLEPPWWWASDQAVPRDSWHGTVDAIAQPAGAGPTALPVNDCPPWHAAMERPRLSLDAMLPLESGVQPERGSRWDVESDGTGDDSDDAHVDGTPPTAALTDLPSVGSASHSKGTCKRCCFYPRGRCVNGFSCDFCHYGHETRQRRNKKKHKPDRKNGA